MSPLLRSTNPTDYNISLLVGLETYKALYSNWPSLYSYISDPLVPTYYFNNLVLGVVSTSGLNFDEAGVVIKNTLSSLVSSDKSNEPTEKDLAVVNPLIDSSYAIKNMHNTSFENLLWISIAIFFAIFILFYFYYVGGVDYLFGQDGLACYNCPSIFDKINF